MISKCRSNSENVTQTKKKRKQKNAVAIYSKHICTQTSQLTQKLTAEHSQQKCKKEDKEGEGTNAIK